MYKLTLALKERQAIDWIGNRYRHGNDLCEILCCRYVIKYSLSHDIKEEDLEWSGDYDITFNVPEHIAWLINDIIKERNYALDCFDGDLKYKLISFSENIV